MMAKKTAAGWANSTFVKTSLPMFGFVVLAWYGLSQLMESKLQIRVSSRCHVAMSGEDAGIACALAATRCKCHGCWYTSPQ